MKLPHISALLLTFTLLLSMQGAVAQSCSDWYFDLKSAGNAQMTSVYQGDSGIAVVAGFFTGTSADLILSNPGTFPLQDQVSLNNPGGVLTLFVALKEGSNGSIIRYAKSYPISANDGRVDAVIYKDGATYVSGYFRGNMDIGSTTLTGIANDAFVLKLDENGDVVWYLQPSGIGWERARRMVLVDTSVYICGYHENNADFGGILATSAFGTEAYVAKLSANTGSVDWVNTMVGPSGKEEFTGITYDESGNVYVSGNTFGGFSYDGVNYPAIGSEDIIIGKFNAQGDLLWMNVFGGTDSDKGHAIVYDEFNELVYMFGSTASSDLAPMGSVLPTYGGQDFFASAFDTAGNVQWFNIGGSTGLDDFESARVLSGGGAVAVGTAANNISYNGRTISSPNFGQLLFSLEIDANGDYVKSKLLGSSTTNAFIDVSSSNNVLASDNIIYAGYYQGLLPQIGPSFTAQAGYDGIVWSQCRTGSSCSENYYHLSGTGDDETTVVYSSEEGFTVIGGQFTTTSAEATLYTPEANPATDVETIQNGSTVSGLYVSLKDSSDGANMLWTTVFPCTGFNVLDEAVYKNGAVYVVGYFDGTLTVDGNALVCPGSVDGFLIKLDATNGNVLWYHQVTGTGWERLLEVVADDTNVYVVGYNEDNATFSGNALVSLFNTDAFVASIEQVHGTVNWISPVNGAAGPISCNSLALGSNGELFAGGNCSGAIQYNGGSATANVNRDGFVMRMDTATGAVSWLNVLGGTGSDGAQDIGFSDVDQLLYYVSVFSSTDMAPMGNNLTNRGGQDVFVLAMDPAGQYQWVKEYGSTGSDDLRDVVALPNGGMALVGFVDGDLQGDVDTVFTSSTGSSIVYMKFDASGNMVDSESFGSSGSNYGYTIASYEDASGADRISIAGCFENAVTIGSNSLTTGGGKDGFVYTLCSDPVSMAVTSDDVWPGDADYNGIANNWDILPIGLIYGDMGPVRSSASNVWVGQPASDWGTQFVNGADHKHTDCDGNGVVDLLDIIPILLNYGETHPKQQLQPRVPGVALNVNFNVDSILAGDTAHFRIDLGVPSSIAQSVYGIAFTINYLPELVVEGSFGVRYDNSWLGDLSVDMEKLDIELYQQGKLDVGMTRVDRSSMSGAGELMSVSVITIDNISGKDLVDMDFPVWVSDVKMIDENGIEIPIDITNDTITLVDVEVGISEQVNTSAFIMYPNPANDKLTIRASNLIDHIIVYDMLGQQVLKLEDIDEQDLTIDLSKYETGMHFIEVKSGTMLARQHLMIIR